MEYRGYKINRIESRDYKDNLCVSWSCCIDSNTTITRGTFQSIKDDIDYQIDNAKDIEELKELNHKAMVSFYSDREKYLYNE
jgi:hypothetical protein